MSNDIAILNSNLIVKVEFMIVQVSVMVHWWKTSVVYVVALV